MIGMQEGWGRLSVAGEELGPFPPWPPGTVLQAGLEQAGVRNAVGEPSLCPLLDLGGQPWCHPHPPRAALVSAAGSEHPEFAVHCPAPNPPTDGVRHSSAPGAGHQGGPRTHVAAPWQGLPFSPRPVGSGGSEAG